MSYDNKTVAQLKVLLEERGLKKSGKKADLIQRLKDLEESILCSTPPSPPSDTPWGGAEYAVSLGPMAWRVSTASHGGIWVSPEGMKLIEPSLRKDDGWYEEDDEYLIPYEALNLGQYEGKPSPKKTSPKKPTPKDFFIDGYDAKKLVTLQKALEYKTTKDDEYININTRRVIKRTKANEKKYGFDANTKLAFPGVTTEKEVKKLAKLALKMLEHNL